MSDDHDPLDEVAPGQDCATCGAPLVPEVLEADGRLGIVWRCAEHGLISAAVDPFA